MRELSQTERAWLWLNSVLGSSVSLTDKLVFSNDGLLELLGSAREHAAIRFPDALNESQRASLYAKCSDDSIDSMLEKLDRSGIDVITRDSADYPALLREIYDPPTVLYVKGSLHGYDKLPIAVVGARKCSDYGSTIADHFGFELARHGACVVSGMASGCDSAAAWGALKDGSSELPTVVLGGGVDVVYPSSNRRLYDAIAERGALISESRPGIMPTRESFPKRNRIISGLSKGVLVVEAAVRSGTSITVACAHEQGRDVFAVPGRLTDITSAGTNGLIKSGGAKAVFGVDDILYEYGIFLTDPPSPVKKTETDALPSEQKTLFEALKKGEKSVDELCDMTGLSAAEINIYLTEMELSGIIKQLPNGVYSV